MNGEPELNLDLIQMVQRARMLHDDQALPSAMSAVYWIEAKASDHAKPTVRAGEWRVRLRVDEVDAVWERVKALTQAGKLGYKSKVSTRPSAGQAEADARLLVARTYDAGDLADVERVGHALRGLGLRDMEYVADKGA